MKEFNKYINILPLSFQNLAVLQEMEKPLDH